jgi:uncharacterized Zn-finger protein
MMPYETIDTDKMVVACDGDGGPLGHPRVYLNLAPAGRAECPYCSRRFVNRAVAGNGGGAMPPLHGLGQERPGGLRDGPPAPAPRRPAPRQPGAAGGGNE